MLYPFLKGLIPLSRIENSCVMSIEIDIKSTDPLVKYLGTPMKNVSKCQR